MKALMKQFWKYVTLNILGMLGVSCYILADTWFVANGIGPMALAALNLALPAYSLLAGIGQMIALGASTKYSIYQAQGKQQEADRIFTDALQLTTLMGVLFTICALLFAEPIAGLLGADAAVRGMAASYLRTVLIFSPFFTLNHLMTAFVRNDGAPALAMASTVAGSLFNILFDYIFVFPMGLGLWGAALATGFSPVVGLFLNALHLLKRRNRFHFTRRTLFHIRLQSAADSCRLGVSSLIAEVSNGAVLIAFNLLMLSLAGNIGVAAYGVVANIAIVVIAIFSGITMGLQPLISTCYGQGNRTDARHIVRWGILLALCISAAITAGSYFLAGPIVALFNVEKDAALSAIAAPGMKLYFSGFLFAGINLILGAAFAAMEEAGKAFLISITRGLVLIIPIAILFAKLFGLNGLWLSFPATELITAVLSLFFWGRERRRA